MAMSEQEIVMVAERAVRDAVDQGMNDLRGEFGLKFQEIQNGVNKFIHQTNEFKTETETSIDELNNNVTESFKKNNELLRSENRQLAEHMRDGQANTIKIMEQMQQHVQQNLPQKCSANRPAKACAHSDASTIWAFKR